QAGRDTQPFERTLFREALADKSDNRHLTRGPFDAVVAFVGERQVLHVIIDRGFDHQLSFAASCSSRSDSSIISLILTVACHCGVGSSRRGMICCMPAASLLQTSKTRRSSTTGSG